MLSLPVNQTHLLLLHSISYQSLHGTCKVLRRLSINCLFHLSQPMEQGKLLIEPQFSEAYSTQATCGWGDEETLSLEQRIMKHILKQVPTIPSQWPKAQIV